MRNSEISSPRSQFSISRSELFCPKTHAERPLATMAKRIEDFYFTGFATSSMAAALIHTRLPSGSSTSRQWRAACSTTTTVVPA